MDDAGTDYLPRGIRSTLDAALADTPVVCLLGPRQVGKTTLVRRLSPDLAYVSMDEAPLQQTARDDPAGFVAGLPDRVILDEVQLAPEVMAPIKLAVDRDRQPGRFILTGSANLLLLPTLTESLAGRMEVIHLHPLTESEKERQAGTFLRKLLQGALEPDIRPDDPGTGEALVRRLLAGGYPEAVRRSPDRARVWHHNYLTSIMERDVREIAQIRQVDDLARLLSYLAQQGASLLNVSNLSKALLLDRTTVDHYLTVLQRLFLIRLLPAWQRNHAKRLIKTPKVHVVDSGLAATLMDLHADDWNLQRQRFGNLLESFVVQQIAAQVAWTDPRLKLYHYRDKDQVEVDCVLTRGARVWGIEVKASQSVSNEDVKGLVRLARIVDADFAGGIVFYNGRSIVPLADGQFHAVPLAKLWEW